MRANVHYAFKNWIEWISLRSLDIAHLQFTAYLIVQYKNTKSCSCLFTLIECRRQRQTARFFSYFFLLSSFHIFFSFGPFPTHILFISSHFHHMDVITCAMSTFRLKMLPVYLHSPRSLIAPCADLFFLSLFVFFLFCYFCRREFSFFR